MSVKGGYFDELDGVEEEPDLPPLEEPSESSQWGQYSDSSYYRGQYGSTSDAGWTYGWYAVPSEAGRRSFRREGEQYGSWSYEPTDPNYTTLAKPIRLLHKKRELFRFTAET